MSSWINNIPGDYNEGIMCWWVDIGGGAGHLMRPLGAYYIQNLRSNGNDAASSVDTRNDTCS